MAVLNQEFKTESSIGLQLCLRECLLHMADCKSVNFKKDAMTCTLNYQDSVTAPNDTLPQDGIILGERRNIQNVEVKFKYSLLMICVA